MLRPNWRAASLRRAIHFASYNFVLNRRRTRTVRADGFRLTVRPTVFHPRYFVASEYFSRFVTQLNLRDRNVLDVGTGTGIIALSAARAGAANVVAVDINPNAALSARENAAAHGFADRVSVVCGDLLAALTPRAKFDVILSNPPFFPEEPIDVADRAWHAGPGYRDIERAVRAGACPARPRWPVLPPAVVGFRSHPDRRTDRAGQIPRPTGRAQIAADRIAGAVRAAAGLIPAIPTVVIPGKAAQRARARNPYSRSWLWISGSRSFVRAPE